MHLLQQTSSDLRPSGQRFASVNDVRARSIDDPQVVHISQANACPPPYSRYWLYVRPAADAEPLVSHCEMTTSPNNSGPMRIGRIKAEQQREMATACLGTLHQRCV